MGPATAAGLTINPANYQTRFCGRYFGLEASVTPETICSE